jgi:hypothetical protein
MIAHLRNTLHNNSRRRLQTTPRRRRSLVQSFYIHLKPMPASRIPLTPKTNFRTAPTPVVQEIRLPRVLPRPSRSEVDAANIVAASPELQNVAPEYIRENLLPVAPQYVFSLLSRLHSLMLHCPGCINLYQT